LNRGERILIAFHSGSKDLLDGFVEQVLKIDPQLGLHVVSEFRPKAGQWIQYYPFRTFRQNLARTQDAVRGKKVVYSALILQPGQPYWKMRTMAALMAPLGILAYNETLSHFRVHPRSALAMASYWRWRLGNLLHHQTHPGGWLYTALWRLYHPWAFRRPVTYGLVQLSGWMARLKKKWMPRQGTIADIKERGPGVSVVVPSRSGKDLLARLLPGLFRELSGIVSEVIVVDNGSDDGTAQWLLAEWPAVRIEESAEALAFAEAANRGAAAAAFSHVMLLNNDMLLEEGFFPPLLAAFESVPDLFCATAQIFFPFGRRREETGKAVMPGKQAVEDFPVRCDLPVSGEDHSYVLYGSGGCSLFESRKLASLGGFSTVYRPAYVEDLDLGYRAWQRGWPTVFVAGARVFHFHRSTTARYYSEEQLRTAVETHYLRFVAKAAGDGKVFARLWKQATWRLNLIAGREPAPKWALLTLREGLKALRWAEAAPQGLHDEESFLALTSGSVAVFPGRARTGRPVVLVGSCYVPFPLSHGGAVRMYNLMSGAARDYDQVLMAFCDELATPPDEVLDMCAEVVLVQREGTHLRPLTDRPDVVEEFDSKAFRAAIKATISKWRPKVVQLEFTQMAQYAEECGTVPTVLVEHDVTLDLYEQLARTDPNWETREQLKRWERFERAAWRTVDCVVAMSEKDRGMIAARRCEVLGNGVDLHRFRPREGEPEEKRILFLGSFQHLPNLLALKFFLEESWPRLREAGATLHVIAGRNHEHFLGLYRERVQVDVMQPGIELEGFVADVRPAYARASVVIAPLLASAGTNIKILEAMATASAIVTTPAGINGIELRDGEDVLVVRDGAEMSSAILRVFGDAELRRTLGSRARQTVEERFSWDAIAQRQRALYESLTTGGPESHSRER
jgi:GT2 family glycosyltransferase/glycosyltransferase involved in cell wall biosynthesis